MCSCLFRKLRSGGSARFSGAAALNVYISKTMKPRERLQKSTFCLFFPLFNIYDCYHYENENKHNYSFSHFQPLCLLLIPCYKTNRKKYTNTHIFNANQLIKSLKKQNMRIMSVTAQTPVKIFHHVVTSTISLMHTSEMHESRAYTRMHHMQAAQKVHKISAL